MNQRTLKQNNSIHLFCEMLSTELNNHGLTIQETLKHAKADIDWTPELVKEILWKKIQKALLKKKSTTKLDTKEVDLVYEHINRFTSQMGISVPFPTSEKKL